MLLFGAATGVVADGPAGLVIALATTAGVVVVGTVGFAAVGVAGTPFGAAAGALGLLSRIVNSNYTGRGMKIEETYSSSSPRRLPKAPIKPPNLATIFVPLSIAGRVLSTLPKGAAGAAAAAAGALPGTAFGTVVAGFAETALEVTGAAGTFAGAPEGAIIKALESAPLMYLQ